jgi:predicted RNA-binding Zn-ribbon protein involved in translation (DUF1610 family)
MLAIALLGLLFAPAPALARPGGGESYSGGGDGGGGGGDGGGGELAFWLLRLWIEFVIRYPAIGVPATIVIIVFIVRRQRRRAAAGLQTWDSAPSKRPPTRPRGRELAAIRGLDPQFSTVLFEDFAYALYARAHQARSDPKALEALSPYLSEGARRHLAGRQPAGVPVAAVVVGALRVLDLQLPPDTPRTAQLASGAGRPGGPSGGAAPAAGTPPPPPGARVEVLLEIESNITLGEVPSAQAQYVRERWRLVRAAGARSKPPEAVRSFHCPNCGAPFEGEGGRCTYCGQVVSDGRFDWSAETIELARLEQRPPALTGTVEEVGTSFPTVFHPELASRKAEILRDDPAVTDAALAARLGLIYSQLNAAWTGLDLARARPFVSDNLFEYLLYWIEAYRRQGLRNVLEGMRLTRSELVKVERDAWYDALTFRIWGSGRDYTVRQATGEVVSGRPKADRSYTEYWTLIRGAGVRGAPRTELTCPNCGAPLDINMAGKCEHCGAEVASGRFDWVLSKIEQDDSYTG